VRERKEGRGDGGALELHAKKVHASGRRKELVRSGKSGRVSILVHQKSQPMIIRGEA